MSTVTGSRKMIIAVGLAASALFIFLAVRGLDFAAVEDVLRRAHVLPWLPLGIASYLLGHLIRGVRCRLLVRREARISLMMASNIVVVGYASNNVLPARLGELVRAGMLAERTGMPIAQSLAVTFIERVLDGLAILFLLLIVTMTGDTPGWTYDLVRVALLVFGIATIVIAMGTVAPGVVIGVASRAGNKLSPKWHDRLVSLATSITNAGACLRDPKDGLLVGVYSILIWTCEAGLFVAILPIFGIPANLQNGALAMCVTNLGLFMPSSPGFIGPFHFFASRALIAQGVDDATALAYATLVHLAFYVPVTLWGAASMLWYGVEVGATAAIARAARKSGKQAEHRGVSYVEIAPIASAPPDPSASAFSIALVEAIVVGPGRSADREAVTYAATFVDGQIAALSSKLRFMFSTGMTVFRFVTRLRYGRGYCDIPVDARRRWTMKWAEGRIALLRKLFKPVRATALLAYYDHERVKQALLAPEVPAKSLVRPAPPPPEPAAAPIEDVVNP